MEGGHGEGEGVTKDQLMRHRKDPTMEVFASNLDIQDVDLPMFFDLLTSHGKRSIDLESFVVGCIKLRGTAKSVDVIELLYEFKLFQQNQERFTKRCKEVWHKQELQADRFRHQREIFEKQCKQELHQ